MEKREYKGYITGLKGIACLFVMFGHFLGLYKYAQEFTPRIPLLDSVLDSQLSFILNEGYWLYLFFVISGYLVAKSKVNTIRDVALKSISRFLRFSFPILFVYVIIYLIGALIGFHSAETSGLFQNEQYQSAFFGGCSISDVLLSPIKVLLLGDVALNSPYWVLRGMFVASLSIYALKYCYSYMIKKNHEALCFSALILITFVSSLITPIITACLMGMLISFYEENQGDINKKPYFAVWIMVILMALYFLPKTILSAFFFASLIIYIPRVKLLNSFFSCKGFRFLGQISWAYIASIGLLFVHWAQFLL